MEKTKEYDSIRYFKHFLLSPGLDMQCIETAGYEDSFLRQCYPSVVHMYTEKPLKVVEGADGDVKIKFLREVDYNTDNTFMTMWKFATAELRGHKKNIHIYNGEQEREEDFYYNIDREIYYKAVNNEVVRCSLGGCDEVAVVGAQVYLPTSPGLKLITPICKHHNTADTNSSQKLKTGVVLARLCEMSGKLLDKYYELLQEKRNRNDPTHTSTLITEVDNYDSYY